MNSISFSSGNYLRSANKENISESIVGSWEYVDESSVNSKRKKLIHVLINFSSFLGDDCALHPGSIIFDKD